jgi:hypothetical protein
MNCNSTEALYQAQEQFLMHLDSMKLPGHHMMLCGGTALARIYLHHRVSYDLDFFVDGQFDPERLSVQLGKLGIRLEDVHIENSGKFVRQLVGYVSIMDTRLKVSFIEDSYAGMFPSRKMPLGDVKFKVESVEGLYHRKLRTVSGGGNSDFPIDGRQAARDLFDLWMLDQIVEPIPTFVKMINQHGANFPVKAFLAGLASMPWIAMMDEFEQIDFDKNNQYLTEIKPLDMMAAVRYRMQAVFKEMVSDGSVISS